MIGPGGSSAPYLGNSVGPLSHLRLTESYYCPCTWETTEKKVKTYQMRQEDLLFLRYWSLRGRVLGGLCSSHYVFIVHGMAHND